MQKRIIFTYDDQISENFNNNKKRLYSRLTADSADLADLSSKVNETNDPLILYVKTNKNEVTNEVDVNKLKDLKLTINILVLQDGNFVQYRGEINDDLIKKLNESGLVEGIGLPNLYIWIYGLLLFGSYDDGINYRFDFYKQNEDYYWSIKFLHFGLFKIILNLQLYKQENIDLDEYFLDDLESYYVDSIESMNQKKQWGIERKKYLKEIDLLKKQSEISKLNESVKLMKSRITDYFLPLVNNLLKEKKELIEAIDGAGDTVFISSIRRKTPRNEFKSEDLEKIRVNLKGETDDDSEENDDWIQRERMKRVKLNEKKKEKKVPKLQDKMEQNDGNVKEQHSPIKKEDDEDIMFERRNKEMVHVETQPDILQVWQDKNNTSNNNEMKMDDSIILNEETQLDEETDISDENENTDKIKTDNFGIHNKDLNVTSKDDFTEISE